MPGVQVLDLRVFALDLTDCCFVERRHVVTKCFFHMRQRLHLHAAFVWRFAKRKRREKKRQGSDGDTYVSFEQHRNRAPLPGGSEIAGIARARAR